MKYRAPRFPTRYPVKLKIGPVGYRSLVTSVSASGVCLSIDQPVAIGQDVALDCPIGQVRGKVKWATDGKVGVMFNRPLARADLDRIRYGLQANVAARRPKIGFAELR